LALQEKAIEKEKKSLEESMIANAGYQNSVGGGIQITKVVRQGNVDYKSLVTKYGIDVEPFRKGPSEYWRVSGT